MEPISETVQRAPPASGEQISGQEIPSQSHVPGSVCTGEPKLHSRNTGTVFGSHTMSYQYWMITQRNNSVIQKRAEQGWTPGRGDSRSNRNTLWSALFIIPNQQRHICYHWWSLQALDVKGWQQAHVATSVFLALVNYHHLGRSSVSYIKWTGIMEIFLSWVLW